METKSITIQVPEGMCIDREHSTFEKIVFKPIDTKPESWEEYCKNFKGRYYYIQDARNNIATSFTSSGSSGLISAYKNYVPSKEYAEAFLALMQLISLRQVWIGDWKPKANSSHWCMYYNIDTNNVDYGQLRISHALEFPTKEMLEEFFHCFKDLLEQAKILL